MRITTIWSIPGIPLAERLRRTKEWAAIKTARRLPTSVKYWTCVGVATLAAGPEQYPPSVTIEQMMEYMRSQGAPSAS